MESIVNAADYPALREEVTRLAKTAHGGFVQDHQELNYLVEIAREHGPEALAPLWRALDRKHGRLHPESRVRRYQASYMSQERRRLADAIEVYKRARPGVRLDKTAREALRLGWKAAWMARREEFIAGAANGEERLALIRAYWEDFDQQLARALEGDSSAARYILCDIEVP